MAIIATWLDETERVRNGTKFHMRFTNDITGQTRTEKFTRQFTGVQAQDHEILRQTGIAFATTLSSYVEPDINITKGATIDVTPDPDVPPTQAQLDKRAWLSDWYEMIAKQQVLNVFTDLSVPARNALQAQIDALNASGSATLEALNNATREEYLEAIR